MPPSPNDLALVMHRFMDAVNRRSAGQTLSLMHDHGLTLPQVVTLHVLRAGWVQDMGGLAECLHLSASSTSHLVDRLVEKCLVERAEDPNDRRVRRVSLTHEGDELVDALARSRAEEVGRALDAISPELRTELYELFERAVAELGIPEMKS